MSEGEITIAVYGGAILFIFAMIDTYNNLRFSYEIKILRDRIVALEESVNRIIFMVDDDE